MAFLRRDPDFEFQYARNPIDDRKPQTEALRLPKSIVEPHELAENRRQLVRGNADARIDDLELRATIAAADANKDRTGAGIFDGVGDEVLDQAAQQVPVGPDNERRRHDHKPEVFPAAMGRKSVPI